MLGRSPLQAAVASFLANEMETLSAVIIRLAIKQHENRNFDTMIMPDSGDMLAQELVDNMITGMKQNRRRKKIVAELRRNVPEGRTEEDVF